MGDAARTGVKLASLSRNPFPVDIIFPAAFVYIDKLIDLRVDMPSQDSALTPDKNYLGTRG